MAAPPCAVDRPVLIAAGRSDVGTHRQRNEDSGYLGATLFAVADGIGGQPHGEVASAIAIEVIAEREAACLGATALDGVPTEIARRLAEAAHRIPGYTGMGSTLVALCWTGDGFSVVHIGDSRCYLLRSGGLRRLTRDHTLVQALVDDGTVSAEEAREHPRRSMLVHALLTSGAGQADTCTVECRVGDRLLLCSDGLSDVLDDAQIESIAGERTDVDAAASTLVEAANEGGGPDNVTVVVVDVVTPAEQSDAATARGPVFLGAASERP